MVTETDFGHQDTREKEVFDIEKNKRPHPSVNWLIPAALISASLIVAGIFMGNVTHRAKTPSIYGTASGRTNTMDNSLDAFDRITIDSDGQVFLTRTIEIDDGTVSLSANGIAKEKVGKFQLSFDRNTMKYDEASEKVLSPKGKEIPAKKLLDKKITYRKKDILPDIIHASYKRPVNGKSKWVSSELSREGSPDTYPRTTK